MICGSTRRKRRSRRRGRCGRKARAMSCAMGISRTFCLMFSEAGLTGVVDGDLFAHLVDGVAEGLERHLAQIMPLAVPARRAISTSQTMDSIRTRLGRMRCRISALFLLTSRNEGRVAVPLIRRRVESL